MRPVQQPSASKKSFAPQGLKCVTESSIPKGLRIKAHGCEDRATLGAGAAQFSTPTGLRLTDEGCPAADLGSNEALLGQRKLKELSQAYIARPNEHDIARISVWF